jgi:tRNA(Ile)-lysidine synthase TilS/MesJ
MNDLNLPNLNTNKNYGIMLSGGLDSVILLGILLATNKDINIQSFTIPKHDWSYKHVQTILNYFNNKHSSKETYYNTMFHLGPVHHRLVKKVINFVKDKL